jgi:hypothetical protein
MNHFSVARIAVLSCVAVWGLAHAGLVVPHGELPAASGPKAAAKSITVVPAFEALQRWATARPAPAPTFTPTARVDQLNLRLLTSTAEETYQPQPLIKGVPDLPLLGATASQATEAWSGRFNYQGMSARIWVLDAKGQQVTVQGLDQPIHVGERFKIQLMPTFDAVVGIDQVVGDPWYGKRTGQAYPAAGKSVAIQAGESVMLPLGDKEFFVMTTSAHERFVMSVRHAKAKGDVRSKQPVYRVESGRTSQYLQLVPEGQYPVIEQQLTPNK